MSFNQFPNQSQPSSLRNNSTQLWMGELDPWWDENSIKSVWNSFGFNSVNVKVIKEKVQQGYNAGYCFVEFPTLELASSALTQNGAKIPNTNKFLKLNWASGNNSVQNVQVPNQNPSLGNRTNEFSIFVGDLSPDVTETILFELFGTKYSSVSSTKIMVDPMSGQSKGYGFVRFLNEIDQQRSLIEMQGAILNSRPIRVSTAVPKNRQQSAQPSQQQQFGAPRQFQQNTQFNQQQPQQQQQQQQQQQSNLLFSNAQSEQILGSLESQYQPPLTQYTDPNNTTVFIGGLSSIVTEEDLRLYFQPFGDITYVKIPIGKGCGFVQYVTRASAELAISKMQGYPIGNSRIRLSWGRSNSNPKPQQYKPQQELPLLYGYSPLHPSSNDLLSPDGSQHSASFAVGQQQHLINQQIQPPQSGFISNSDYGVNGIQSNPNNFNNNEAESIDQSRLNQLFIAARDGRLDAIESAANGYIFA